MATQAEIQAWANAIGLPYCVGDEYQREHNGALPPTRDALVSWGNSTGRRDAAGGWTCKGAGNGGGSGGGSGQLGQIIGWIGRYPVYALGGVVALLLLAKSRR